MDTAQPSPSGAATPTSGLSQSADLASLIDACLIRLKAATQALANSAEFAQFANPPASHNVYVPDVTRGSLPQYLKLAPHAVSNAPFIAYQKELNEAEELVARNSKDERIQARLQLGILSEVIVQYRKQYNTLVAEEWKRQCDARLQPNFIDTQRYHQPTLRLLQPNILALYLMVAALYLLSNVSQQDCGFMLSVLKMTMGSLAETSSSLYSRTSAQSMVVNVDNVVQLLNIYPSPTTFVCCDACYCLYWFDPGDASPNYPSRCTNQTEHGTCDSPLRKTKKLRNGEKKVPVREFLYRDAADYISQMHAREDVAGWLCDDPAERPSDPDNAWDIWDAPALRDFTYIDGQRFTSSTEESRLVFSLNFDGFNPGGNREAGKVVKVGAIYLVCLNLPPAIRYNIENVYLVGIVPGPGGPSTDEINHLIKPLVNDFIGLWRTGIYLSRTHSHRNGIRVRGAIIPLVCDLPAARQMAGSANYMHTDFCSECKQKKADINDLDCSSWEPRTWAEHKEQAEQWRNASTPEVRAKLVKAHGVRWSELLRLPYWDPTRFTLIDSMHAFYLRIFQHHIRKIWGMDIDLDDGEGITRDRAAKAPDESALRKAQDVFRHGSMSKLQALSHATLIELCRDTGSLPVRGQKGVLLRKMRQYRIDQGWFLNDGTCTAKNGQGLDNPGVNRKDGEGGRGNEDTSNDAGDGGSDNDENERDKIVDGDEDSAFEENDGDGVDADDNYEDELDDLEDGEDDDDPGEQDGDDSDDYDESDYEGDDLEDSDGNEEDDEEKQEEDGGDEDEDSGDEEFGGSEELGEPMDEGMDSDKSAGRTDQMEVDPERNDGGGSAANANHGEWKLLRDGITDTFTFLTCAAPSKVKTAVKEDLHKVFYDHIAPNLPPDVVHAAARFKNDTLVSYILEERRRRGIEVGPAVAKPKRTRVLGRNTLKEIRSDMRSLNRPSWQANGPIKPGEAKRGKFTADQWRTFCTVNLPVTLIRLWGGAEEGSLERRRLDNFMHLVTAVKLATMNAMNEQRILEYEHHMRRYLETLLELYPATQLTPYQHLSLHFGRHLRMFGPVHAWRCFPFERYNFIIQSIPTNNKFSELEKTMFRKFTAAQHLRGIFSDCKGLPDAVKPMIPLFQKNYNTKFQANLSELFVDDEIWGGRGDSSWDIDKLDSIPLEVRLDLVAWLHLHDSGCTDIPVVAHFHDTIIRYGRKVATFWKHRNDSQVIFSTAANPRAAGTVRVIFSHRRQKADGSFAVQTFAVIRPYEELEAHDEELDLYRRYHPDTSGRLVYNSLAEDGVLVPISNIWSHFASQVQVVPGIQRECLMVQPLSRH